MFQEAPPPSCITHFPLPTGLDSTYKYKAGSCLKKKNPLLHENELLPSYHPISLLYSETALDVVGAHSPHCSPANLIQAGFHSSQGHTCPFNPRAKPAPPQTGCSQPLPRGWGKRPPSRDPSTHRSTPPRPACPVHSTRALASPCLPCLFTLSGPLPNYTRQHTARATCTHALPLQWLHGMAAGGAGGGAARVTPLGPGTASLIPHHCCSRDSNSHKCNSPPAPSRPLTPNLVPHLLVLSGLPNPMGPS